MSLRDFITGISQLPETVNNILEVVMTTQTAIDALKQKVADQTTVVQSAVTLLQGLAQQIRDNADDPAELNALADSLDANTNALGQAVKDNSEPRWSRLFSHRLYFFEANRLMSCDVSSPDYHLTVEREFTEYDTVTGGGGEMDISTPAA